MTKQSRISRLILGAAVALAGGVLAGCPQVAGPGGQVTENTMPGSQGTAMGGDAPLVGREPLAGGVYESVGTEKTLTGAALAKARLDRAAILAIVKPKEPPAATVHATRPAATAPADATNPAAAMPPVAVAPNTQPAPQPGERDDVDNNAPPPAAVKYYLQGREKFIEGSNTEAMDLLEKALQLDPDAFTVLRLMGRVCFAATQLARGSMYLERAQHLRPTDVEVNYLLGRYWLERKDFDRAVYYLMQADDSPEKETSSTQTPLSAFYLARAMQAGGYHAAAAKEYERFIDLAGLPVAGYRYDRELSYLIDELWAAHLAAAENDVVAGNFTAAIPHYRAAAAQQPKEAFIASRLVNALSHAGKAQEARQAALALLAATHGTEDAIGLLAWTYRVAGHEQELIADLKAQLKARPDDSVAALTLAATQEYLAKPDDAFRTQNDFLKTHPKDLEVLARLIKHVSDPTEFAEAQQACAAAITADRSLNDAVIKLFVPLADGPVGAQFMAGVRAGHWQLFNGEPGFAYRYLATINMRLHDDEPDHVDAAFSGALKLAPDFAPLRDAYVSWLLAQEKFSQAAEIVRKAVAADENNPKVWILLVDSEMSQQRYLSALKLAEDGKKKFPASQEIGLELASIYRVRGQDAEADAELKSLIEVSPRYEPAYKALIESQFARSRTGQGPGNDALVQAIGKMTQNLPDARYAQVAAAIVLARAGQLDQAEAVLRRILPDNAEDPDVLVTLSQVRLLRDRPDEAVGTLAAAIKANPQVVLVRALARLYGDLDRPDDALALTRKMTEQNPTSEAFAILYATQLASQDKQPEGIAVLKEALKRFPRAENVAMALARMEDQADHHEDAVLSLQAFIKENGITTQRLYALAGFFTRSGNEEAAAAAMQQLLTIMPDNIGANNDLGYFWVDRGAHMEEAEKMIHKAVENMPNNAAFMDSLGWLLYKQGKFQDAVTTLQKAVAMPDGVEPEVIGHLGDAMYRAGRNDEAMACWRRALDMLTRAHNLSSEETQKKDYLTRTIGEAAAGHVPALSPLAPPLAGTTMPNIKSAGPATVPAENSQ